MRTSTRAPLWLDLVAASFLAYFALLVYCDFWGPQPFGVLTEFTGARKVVRAVFPRSPAERAGLQVGDRIVAADGHGIRNLFDWTPIRVNLEVGRPCRLEVERHGARFALLVTLERASWSDWTSREGSVLLAVRAAQLVTLLLALAMVFSRPYDVVARVGAWLLGTMATTSLLLPYGMAATWRLLPQLVGLLLWIPLVSTLAFAPLAFTFFALFPRRLITSRAVWLLVWAPVAASFPWLARYFHHMVYRPWSIGPVPEWTLVASNAVIPVYVLGGLAALVAGYRGLEDRRERRRVRVLVVGSIVGWIAVLPLFLYWWAPASRLAPAFFLSPAMLLSIALFLLFPLSFAYAVVRHRVLEIPVLLRRSARYLLVQRGFVVLVGALSLAATTLFVRLFARLATGGRALPAGLAAGVGLGSLLAWAGSQAVRRTTQRIDRAFFRSAYDSRLILQDLGLQARTTTRRDELAALLARHLDQALRPRSLAVYLEEGGTRLKLALGKAPGGLESIDARVPELADLARRGEPREVRAEESILAPLLPDCLVPVLGRESRLLGLVVLGARLSDEPYSGEDRRLLAAVTGQVGLALESIRLAEEMAARLETERRAAHEIEIARQVQQKLLPQRKPPLETLEYAGGCVQARAVGGDYYDFLDLGPGRAALVLADISGKGISAALLMANLQANLRSQYALALTDLGALVRSVNGLFWESTAPERYATAFLAVYEDASRRLRYVNCGHNPPLLLRASGAIERLAATATVLGMFEEWSCAVEAVTLASGDLLAVFSDGVSEAGSDRDREFGERRLIEALECNRALAVERLLESVMAEIGAWSGAELADDVTLVLARGR